MRLIDADELYDRFGIPHNEKGSVLCCCECPRTYECHMENTSVGEFCEAVDDTKTVDAIPVEVIEKVLTKVMGATGNLLPRYLIEVMRKEVEGEKE